mgnify:CR=1 FL=1
MQAIVLAGGLGTRLREVVSDLPKPMAPIGDRPFLSILFDQIRRHGCNRAFVSVGYKADAIVNHYGSEFDGMSLDYVREAEPLGTGGALRLALGRASDDHVLVLNGDTYFDIGIADIYQEHVKANRSATLVLRWVEEATRYGTVEVSGNAVTAFNAAGVAGPALINSGIYVLSRELFSRFELPAAFSFEQDFLQRYANDLKLSAASASGMFVDIGVPEDYRWACTHVAT